MELFRIIVVKFEEFQVHGVWKSLSMFAQISIFSILIAICIYFEIKMLFVNQRWPLKVLLRISFRWSHSSHLCGSLETTFTNLFRIFVWWFLRYLWQLERTLAYSMTYLQTGLWRNTTFLRVVLRLITMNLERNLTTIIQRPVIIILVLFLLGWKLLFLYVNLVSTANDIGQLLFVFWHHHRIGIHDF